MNTSWADSRSKVAEVITAWGKSSGTSARTVKRIIKGLLPSIRLVPRAADTSPTGGSRVGGLPDLPAGVTWPRAKADDPKSRPLWFFMQVNLAEVAALDSQKVLP